MKTTLQNSKIMSTVLLLMTLFTVSMSFGQKTWDRGANTNNWGDANNWSPNGVPTSGQTVTIGDDYTVTVNVAAVCSSLTFASGGNDSTVTISGSNSLTVTNAITINGGTGNGDNRILAVGAGTLTCGSISITDPGSDIRYSDITLSTGTINVSGGIAMAGNATRNNVVFTSTGTLNIGGSITGGGITPSTGTVNYNNAGNQTIGTTSYTYNNFTTSGSGDKTLSANITVNGSLSVQGTSVLLPNATSRINDGAAIRLNGGTYRTGATTGYSDTVGVLTLAEDSNLILGTTNHTLTFANSNAASWTSGKMLTITGWQGGYNGTTAGSNPKIFFSNSSSALTAAQLEQIRFFNGTNYFFAMLLGSGELVPTPVRVSSFSPTTVCAGGTITITGAGFTNVTVTGVQVNGANVSSFNVNSDTSITATLTNSNTSGAVSVITSAGTYTSGSGNLTVSNLFPTSVTATPGASTICNGGSTSLTTAFSYPPSTVNNSASPAANIPDNDQVTGVTSQITLPSTCASANEVSAVTLNISHSYAADLDIFLVSPNGTQIPLCRDKGASTDNIVATFQTGGISLSNAAINSTINGPYAPETAFSTFSGAGAGIWTLRVYDDAAQDTGILNSWSITVNSATCGVMTYSWSPVTGLSSSTVQNPTATPASTTGYAVTVTTPNGCAATSAVTTITVKNTWLGTTSNAWNVGSNWSCGVPTASSDVVISTAANYPEISSEVTINSLTLDSGTTLKVNPAYDLTVTGIIHNNGTLTIENTANLVQVNDVDNTGSGTTVVKRNSSAVKRLDYTLWSSPVTGQGLYAFSPLTLSTRFYQYLTATNLYNNSGLGFSISGADPVTGIGGTDTANIQFATAKGYLIRAPWNHPTAPAVWTGTFTGVPNNGDIPVTVSTAGEPVIGYGYNAVGNPYPSRLSVPAFIDGNTNISGTLYLWRKTNDNATTSYATLTKTAYVANGAPGGDTGTGFFPNGNGAEANWVLNVGQGFFVKVNSGSSINFTNGMRRSSNANQFFRNSQTVNTVNNGLYWLNLNTSNGVYSQMAVGYSEEGTLDFDRGMDGENINKEFYLTSLIDTKEYSVQSRPSFEPTDVVPLSYKVETAGNHSISIDHTSGLFSAGQVIYLRDNLTSTIHNLNSGAYNFSTEAGTFTTRFEVMYQLPLGIDNPTFNENQVVIYQNEANSFGINTGDIVMSSVKVFDVRGRLLLENKGINASQTTITAGQANEVLLVQITSQDGMVVTKKVLR